MQGRFKRDSSAAAEQEPRGGTDRGSSPQHTQNPGPAPSGESGGRGGPPGAKSGGHDAPADQPGAKAKDPTDPGSRVALRNWRISTRLVALLTLPVVAATTLGGLRINDSLNEMQQLEHMQLLTKMTKEATNLAQALQAERDESAGPLTNGANAKDFRVQDRRTKTDRAKKGFLDTTVDIGNTDGDQALESIRSNVNQIATQVNGINDIRKDAYRSDAHSLTVDAYSGLIDSLLSLSQDMAQATSNPDMIKRTRALAAFSSAKEYASIQRAIIAAALPADPKNKGTLNENDRLYGLAAQKKERNALTSFRALYEAMGGDAEALMAPLNGQGSPEIQASEKYADRVLDRTGGLAAQPNRSYLDWTDQASTRIVAMKNIEATLLGEMEAKARELRDSSQRDALINGAVILLVLGVSLVGAFVVARSMIRSLRRLQDTATRVAQDRLPELVKQLSDSDPQDVDTSVESVGVHSRDEIGKVAAAFDDVHREAVRLAAEQALLRGNVNAMFTNLSRRSQGLIQRQLSLISELESREADPDQLSSLFKLDHLATRMRRNGENLLVLAGEEPGRRWTRPVPLVDVLRAAASEVEQYERIELAQVPATEVAGRVVNDLVHLLAELLENATSFSSPQTKVRVTGHALPDGRVLVEIHDTGIGLSPEDLAAINERLASPPTVDVSVSRRMGLFVVGRLSLRHGIRIQLRPSDSGGTTALVMLPVDVAHGGKKGPVGRPGQNGPGQGGPVGGQLPGGSGAAGGGRPGAAPGGSPAPGLLGAGAPRGQVGPGASPRAALPARDGTPGGSQGGPQAGPPRSGGPQDPQRQGGGQPSVFAQNAFGPPPQNRGGQPPAPQGQSGQGGQVGSQGGQGGQGGGQGGQNGFSGRAQNTFQQGGAPGGRQLPPPGGPRAELPGGNPQPKRPQTTSWGADQSSGAQRPSPDAPRGHEEHDSTGQFPRPAGDQQGPAATAEFPRPDFNAPRPDQNAPLGSAQDAAATAQFPRPDFGAPAPTGYNAEYNGRQDQNDRSGFRPQSDFGGQQDFNAPRPPAPAPVPGSEGGYRPPSLPAQPQPEALPPAGPGDGSTPLYDNLETNWFHTTQQGGGVPDGRPQSGEPERRDESQFPAQPSSAPSAFEPPRSEPAAYEPAAYEPSSFEPPRRQEPPMPRREPLMPRRDSSNGSGANGSGTNGRGTNGSGINGTSAGGFGTIDSGTNSFGAPSGDNGSGNSGSGTNGVGANSSWRTSPNDELVRQAERAKKPQAGGLTTSGLPRRVPRANLVPGTAQEQNTQAGPQVSRAPADVRGRLTNLRRGIQQGRQAGNTGPASNGFNLGTSHQQER
ncbi:nitrate- and nitrite sensing domain-containing protein [Streptomyces sp. NBC_01429]|uniref:nitrate- and nitrite sensing domain-containing protein n=1 Tax=Streptomyces sp. NBC_01429 TaxID=2903862 RepID=UPI002E2CEA22|nr:nitrate- and nitrite sensing domain-containing protein [Streptomyces sp. NBC_01429]